MGNKSNGKHSFIYASSFLLCGFLTMGCHNFGKRTQTDSAVSVEDSTKIAERGIHFEPGNTVRTRYEVPPGYQRVQTEKGSFEEFLQNLPLKPEGHPTHLYDGTEKDEKVATAVIDLDVDSVDLQHSAGAVIRLRAEYLYSTGQYEKIHFKLKNGLDCNYSKWAQGFRITAEQGQIRWTKVSNEEDYNDSTFREYLRTVFRYTDEKSLAKEMKDDTPEEFGIGTVIFNSLPPYNVGIVVDMIEIKPTSYQALYGYVPDYDKAILLAQGGNPAQEIEILGGNRDELNLFHENGKEKKFGHTWATQLKGEQQMNVQGGRFWTDQIYYFNKKIKLFYEDE